MSRNYNFKARYFGSYAKALGELILVWNDLHMVLSSLFETVIRIPNRMAPNSIWNNLDSDRRQRELLKVLVELNAIHYDIPKNLRKEILWALAEIDKIENARNNLVHAPIYIEAPGDFIPWHHLGNKRAINLKNKDLLKEARLNYNRAIRLREYVEKLNDTLGQTQRRQTGARLPKRPSLPNRGDSNGKK